MPRISQKVFDIFLELMGQFVIEIYLPQMPRISQKVFNIFLELMGQFVIEISPADTAELAEGI